MPCDFLANFTYLITIEHWQVPYAETSPAGSFPAR